jgi:hypothetical protein
MASAVLQYPANAPPVAVLAAARIGGVAVKATPEKEWPNAAAPTLTLEDGAKLTGVASLLRYVARASPASVGLYGVDGVASTLVRGASSFRNHRRCSDPSSLVAFSAL